MTHRFLLLLVVCTIVSTWNEVAIAQEIATPYHQTNTQRLLTNGVVNPDDVDDERGISMLSVRNIQTFFGRNSGLTKKLTNVHRSDGGVTAVEKNTAVSKMVTVLDKNPASLNKLVKDPNMIQVATSLNKQSGKFTKTDVSALRKVFANNPVKANKFDVAIKFIRKAMIGVVSVGMAALIILALITLVTAMA